MFASNTVGKKFMVPTLLLTVLLLSLLGMFMAMNSVSAIKSMLQSKAGAMADFMSKVSIPSYESFDYPALDNLIQEITKNPEVDFAVFYDSKSKPLTKETKKIGPSFIVLERKIVDKSGLHLGYLKLGFNKAAISNNLRKSIIILSTSVAVAIFLFIFGIRILTRWVILRPITHMKYVSGKMASGDLTNLIETGGNDEIAELGMAINTMASNLKDMIFRIRSITNAVSNVTAVIAASSHKVLDTANVQKKAIEETALSIDNMNDSISSVASNIENLSNLSEETASSVMQMNISIDTVAENSGVFFESSQETASSIEEMIASIKQIAENLDILSASSDETASAISEMNASVKEVQRSANESVKLAETVNTYASEEGMNAIHAATKGIKDIKENMRALSDVINRLRKRSSEIGKIVTVIDDITDQTTLLAINAAILASKAGEHGKGFSVVANEIKDLAEKTSISTNEISNLITSVQDETKSSVEMTSKGIQAVEVGMKLFDNVSSALNSIITSSLSSTDMAKMIQRATEQEVHAINQITNAAKNMTEQINQIAAATGEQNKGSKFIIEAAEKMKDLSLQLKTTTTEQSRGSKQITGAIENITHQTAQIAEAANSQKTQSTEIDKAMDRIQGSTDGLIQSSVEMNSEISALSNEAQNLLLALQKFRV